jgi:hypothetical protein
MVVEAGGTVEKFKVRTVHVTSAVNFFVKAGLKG